MCKLLFKSFLVGMLMLGMSNSEGAPIPLSTPYSESFDTLPASGVGNAFTWTNDSTLPGWYTLNAANYYVTDGSVQAGTGPRVYSFGTGTNTDRALGALSTATIVYYGVTLKNDTSQPITELDVSYTGEQWRSAGSTTTILEFSYQTGASNLTTGTWNLISGLNFTNPSSVAAGSLNGNLAANRTLIPVTTLYLLPSSVVPVGGTIWLRWKNATGHALGIDDLQVTARSPAVILTPLVSSSIGEGSTTTYTVKLNTQPTANVTVTPTLDAQLNIIPSTLTFTSTNYSTPQTITVTAVDDSIDEGSHSGTISHTATSIDTYYNNISVGNISATITDNDTAGVTPSAMSGGVGEGGSSASYNIKLNSTPTNNVTITITPDTQLSVVPSTLTFTPANALTDQTVTVSAIDDFLLENAHTGTLTHSVTSSDPKYNSIAVSNVTANITDNDSASFTFSSSTVNVAEGGLLATYTIKLNTIPTANVTITPTPDAQVNVTPSDLTFTSANFSTPQTFTVTTVDDSIDEGTHNGMISHTASSLDGNYNNLPIGNVTATITDNDTAGVTISNLNVNIAEGGTTATYTVKLNTIPTNPVTVSLNTGTQISPISNLTFAADGTALTAQTVTVSAIDDTSVEGTHTGTITHSVTSSDAKYHGMTVSNVTANITDNDAAGLTITPTSINVTEGGSVTYTVKLNTTPAQPVTVKFNTDAQINSILDLNFTPATAFIPQTVTVAAVDNTITEGTHTSTISHTVTSLDTDYSGITSSSVTVNIADNDSPGVTLSTSSVNVAESGITATYTVKLNTVPVNVVKISFDTGIQITPIADLTFQPDATALNPQTVTVSAIDDATVEKAHTWTITHSAANSSDITYKTVTIGSVIANITDNDGAGITTTPHLLDLMEGRSPGSYSVKLNTIPIAPVKISFHANDQIYPIAEITFQADATALNPQNVTVTAVDDKVYEQGDQHVTITHTATSADSSYQGANLSDQNVVIGIGDDDLPPPSIPPTNDNPSTGGDNSGSSPPPSSSPPPDKASLFVQVDGSGQQGSQVTLFPLPETTCQAPKGQSCSMYKYSNEVTLTATPALHAFFSGWGGNEDCGSTTQTTKVILSATKLCVAYFHLKPHKLTFSQTGEGQGQVSTSLPGKNLEHSDVECDNSCYPSGSSVKLIATPAGDSSFVGWSGDEDCKDGQVTLGEDKHCEANFALLPTYALTWGVNGNGQVAPTVAGTVCGANCARYIENTEVTLNATPATGSTFTGWSGACSQEGKVTLSTDQQCIATFSLQPTYQLVVTTVGNGTINFPPGNPCGQQCMAYLLGTPVTLTAIPATGFIFNGWQGEGCVHGQVIMDKNQQCTAVFTSTSEPPSTYQLVVSQNGTGKGKVTYTPIGAPCETGAVCYNKGMVVTLTAQHDSGSSFAGWSGDCNVQGQVVMETDKHCSATFNSLPVLTVSKTGEGQVTSQPTGIQCGEVCRSPYEVGKIVTLTPTAATGSRFEKWEGDSDCAAGQITLDKDKECVAVFKQVSTVQFDQPTYEAREDNPQTTFKVSRKGDSKGKISVVYTTQGGTATPQEDYLPVTGKLTWEEGDSTDKTFSVTLLLDQAQDNQETVQLQLLDPIGEVSLGTPSDAILTIANAPWFSSLQFATPSSLVNESDQQAILLVTRAGSSLGALSVDYASSDGTAVAGNDYTPVKGTLTWAEGNRNHQLIEIPLLKDTDNESNENFVVTLSHPTNGAELGQTAQTSVTVISSPDGGTLQFRAAEYTHDEHEGAITLEVQRLGGSKNAVSVAYTTSDGTAYNGQDYTTTMGVLNWADEDHETKQINVPILADTFPEDSETFSVTLSHPTGNSNLGAIITAQVNIKETQASSAALVEFDQENYQVDENQGSAQLTLRRTRSTQGEVQVSYRIEEDTAKAYSDYIPKQGIIHWNAGEEGNKPLSVDLLDDLTLEASKTFKVILSDPTGQTQLGHIPQATVMIEDNDTGTLQFSQAIYQVSENLPEVKVSVSRLGNTLGEVSVQYTTLPNTAMADQDFIAQAGRLKWSNSDNTEKTITIPLVYDLTSEGDETFQVLLSDIKGPAMLNDPKETTITITENASTQGCQLQGNVVDCFYDNTNGTLKDIKITPRGVVLGGQLYGTIQNRGMIKNAMLGPHTIVYGGKIGGTLQGFSPLTVDEKPATLGEVTLLANINLEHVLVGRGSIFEGNALLGTGVRFEDNSTIPYNIDLSGILGKSSSSVFGQSAILLENDVLQHSAIGGILGAINSLYALRNQNMTLTQHPLWGYLKTEVGEAHYSALPWQVKQVFNKLGTEENQVREGILTTPEEGIAFVTHTGREIIALPVIQAPEAFQNALRQLGWTEVSMQENGNLIIPTSQGTYLAARPSLYSLPVSEEVPPGLSLPTGQASVSFVFDDEGTRRQQFLYPAPAAPLEDQWFWSEGTLSGQIGHRFYQGQLDYWVTSGPRSAEYVLQIVDIADVNGDGLNDYQIIYPQGTQQILFAQ